MTTRRRIIRSAHDVENPYVMIRKDIAQNKSLSWEARGVLCYLLSQHDGWKLEIADLKQNCGEHTVYRVLKELKAAGYVVQEKHRNAKNQFIYGDYLVYEYPHRENQDVGNQDVGNPRLENRDTKDINTKKENKDKKESTAPAKRAVQAPKPSIGKVERPTLPKEVQSAIGEYVMEWKTLTNWHWSQLNAATLATNLLPFNLTMDEIKDFRRWYFWRFPTAPYTHPSIIVSKIDLMRSDIAAKRFKLSSQNGVKPTVDQTLLDAMSPSADDFVTTGGQDANAA